MGIITFVPWERNRGSSYSDLEVTSPNPKNPEPSGLPGVLRCACTLSRKTNNNEQTILLRTCVFQSWKLFQDCVTTAPIRQVNILPRRLFPLDLQVRRKGLSWSPPHHRIPGPPAGRAPAGPTAEGSHKPTRPGYTRLMRSVPTVLAAAFTPHLQPLKSTVWRRMELGSSLRRLTWTRRWHPELNSASYHLLSASFPLIFFFF